MGASYSSQPLSHSKILVVKHKLNSLEDVVDDKTERAEARLSGKSTPVDNRKVIHDLLVKINDEINEIHKLCRQNKELDCLNTVIDVLSKVCTYIDNILDTLRMWKKDVIVAYNPYDGEVADVTVDIKKEEEEEVTNTLVMYTSGAEKSCITTTVAQTFAKKEEMMSVSYTHHSHRPCLHIKTEAEWWDVVEIEEGKSDTLWIDREETPGTLPSPYSPFPLLSLPPCPSI